MIGKKLARDTVIYGGSDFVGKMIAFFTFPLIASALTPKAFGALELINTVIGLAGLIVGCGLNNSVQRYYWDEKIAENKRPSLVSTGLAMQSIFAVVIICVGALAMPALHIWSDQASLPLSQTGLYAALSLLLATQLMQYVQDVTRLQFSPFSFLTISFFNRVFGAVLAMLVVVVWKAGVDGYLIVQAIATFLAIPVGLWLIRKDLTFKIDSYLAKQLFDFGHPYIFAGLAYWLFGSMDRWMLTSMSSVEETGLYSVAFRFSSLVFFVSAAFGQAWSPYAIKLRTDHPEHYRKMYASVLTLLFFVMFVIGGGLALFAGELLGNIMPKEYAGSALPLAILSVGVVLQATTQITAIGISLERKTYLFSRLAWLTAAINLAGNWFLIPRYGATGSAVATAFSYLVLTASYFLFTQRLHPLPIRWRHVAWLLLLGGIVSGVSVAYCTVVFDWATVLLKLLLALVCIALAWPVLPFKELKHV
ncbi:flippase [Vogesella indigofera]|uniref:flippase n=1 Tax=Vogesella indigofera TaxID=45465 RepID=UPI0035AE8593